jgi:hypothetical protein
MAVPHRVRLLDVEPETLSSGAPLERQVGDSGVVSVRQRVAGDEQMVGVAYEGLEREPESLGVVTTAVLLVHEREPDRLGSDQPARAPILFASGAGGQTRRAVASAPIPVPRRQVGVWVASEDRDDHDGRARTCCSRQGCPERENGVVRMGREDEQPASP